MTPAAERRDAAPALWGHAADRAEVHFIVFGCCWLPAPRSCGDSAPGGGAGQGTPHGGGVGPAMQRLPGSEGAPSQMKLRPLPGPQCGHGVQMQQELLLAGVPTTWHGACSAWHVGGTTEAGAPTPQASSNIIMDIYAVLLDIILDARHLQEVKSYYIVPAAGRKSMVAYGCVRY